MRHEPTDHFIPAAPPSEVLAELDAAARALDALDARGARVTLAMDDRSPELRIALEERDGVRPLTATQLFDLLA